MVARTPNEILQGAQDSLNDGPYACTSFEVLTGGTANFVYRGALVTPLEDGSNTVVIKHTEGFVASNHDFKLTASRCDFEQSILISLEKLPPAEYSGITVQTPHVYDFSSTTNTQIYSDLPDSTDLKTFALTHPLTQEQCSSLGQSIGVWAKGFHTWAAVPEQEGLRETMKGNKAMRELKYMINYSTLLSRIDGFPEILEGSRKVFEDVAASIKADSDDGNGMSLIQGDFWPGNVLLPNVPLPNPETPLKLYIIDWELSQIGPIAFDLGQMFAELFELKHFKDIDAGVQLIEAFMGGYGSIDEDSAFKTAIHVGVHLICWGSSVPGWGTREQIEEVVKVGRGFVVEGWKRNRRFFDEGLLGCLFR